MLAAIWLLASFARWFRSKWFLMWIIYYLVGLRHDGRHHEGRLTRPERVGVRLGVLMVFLWIVVGMLYDPRATITGLGIFLLVLFAAVLALVARVAWMWRHYRKWLRPLHLAAHQVAEIPRGRSPVPWSVNPWLKIDRSRTRVVAALPAGWPADEKDKQRLVSTIVQKTGIPNPHPSWHLAGPKPTLMLEAVEPPPPKVLLSYEIRPKFTARDAIECTRSDEVVWGVGRRNEIVKTSLSEDSPHAGMSMGSGAGKSIAARAFLAQMLYKGCIGIILDYKKISHQWARGLPNVAIYRRPREIHDVLVWLANEGEHRNEYAELHSDDEGNVLGLVGPRIVVVCEELNAAMRALRMEWRQMRAVNRELPQRSPALDALDMTNMMGRQVLLNLLYMGQRLSVKAIGGDGDARESINVIAFGRFKESNWKMLAGDFPMPAKSLIPGRIQVVTDKVQECQGIFMTAKEAKALALAGTVAELPDNLPGARRVPGGTHPAIANPDQPLSQGQGPVVPALPGFVTLREASSDKGEAVVDLTLDALRKVAQRDPDFPRRRGFRGLAGEYDPSELSDWEMAR